MKKDTKRYLRLIICHLKKFLSQLSLWIVNLCIKSDTICLYFILYLHVRIRIRIPIKDPIHKAPEYGSNTDPDPQHL